MRLQRPVFVVSMIGAFITAILATQASFKLSPSDSTAAGLAIAAMTSFALSLIHDLDATIMILIWNLGVAAPIAGLANAFGRPTLSWVAARVMPALSRNCPRCDSEGSRSLEPVWESRS